MCYTMILLYSIHILRTAAPSKTKVILQGTLRNSIGHSCGFYIPRASDPRGGILSAMRPRSFSRVFWQLKLQGLGFAVGFGLGFRAYRATRLRV